MHAFSGNHPRGRSTILCSRAHVWNNWMSTYMDGVPFYLPSCVAAAIYFSFILYQHTTYQKNKILESIAFYQNSSCPPEAVCLALPHAGPSSVMQITQSFAALIDSLIPGSPFALGKKSKNMVPITNLRSSLNGTLLLI